VVAEPLTSALAELALVFRHLEVHETRLSGRGIPGN